MTCWAARSCGGSPKAEYQVLHTINLVSTSAKNDLAKESEVVTNAVKPGVRISDGHIYLYAAKKII